MQTLHLSAEPADAHSHAGEPVVLRLALHNAGRIPYQCRLDVSGLPRAWYHLEDAVLVLAPGATAYRELTLTPPTTAAGPVGQYPFRVQASVPEDPAVQAAAVVRLSVGLRQALRLEVQPEEIRGRQGAVTVRVSNALPWPATVLLGVTVADEALRVRLDPAAPLVVPAGGASVVALHVTRRARGGAQAHVITVWGRQPGEEPTAPPRLTGQVRVHDTRGGNGGVAPVRRRLPRGVVPVVTLFSLLLALAAAAGAGMLRGLPAPPAPRRTPTPVLMRTVLAARVVRRTPARPGARVPSRVRLTMASATPWPTAAPSPSPTARPTSMPHPPATPRRAVTPTPTVFTITLS